MNTISNDYQARYELYRVSWREIGERYINQIIEDSQIASVQ